MIVAHREGLSVNDEFFDRELCVQVLGSWDLPHDQIGLHDDLLYAKTGTTQHGVDERYRDILRSYHAQVPKFHEAKRDLKIAKDDSAKFARQNPVIRTVKSIFGQEGPSLVKYGNVWVRRWWWRKGDTLDGHKHNFDHISLLYRGSAKVTVDDVETTYVAPVEIIITKEKTHFVTALEDNTVWMCVFAVRDDQGEVDIFGESNDPASHT